MASLVAPDVPNKQRKARRPSQEPTAHDVGRSLNPVLVDMLPAGEAGQTEVARRLKLSVSSLQRGLRAEGQTFRQVLETTRKSLALRYIQEGTYALSEVAYLLGFADQSSMTRAFRRWTGVAPSEYVA